MFDMRAVKEGFGRAAWRYDEHAHLQRRVREYALALGKRYWPDHSHILDLGCGTGALANEAPMWDMLGLDLSPGMCAVARERCRTVNADACAMPFAGQSFDGVFSSLMLQWVERSADAFAEMMRVLKPGCHAVLATLTYGTLKELKEAFAAFDGAPHVNSFQEPHRLLADAEAAGFSLEMAKQTRTIEYYPHTIAIMRDLQAIGATNKRTERRRGLMTPKQFTLLEQAYPRQARGLPVTWQVLHLALRKNG